MPEASAVVDPRRNTRGNKPSLAETHKALADEWDAGRNGELTPWDVSAGSHKRIWWVCAEHGHNWSARVDHRSAGHGCPFCENQVLLTGYNDLKTKNKDLAAQFFSQNNGGVTPDCVLGGSSGKKWVWTCKLGHNWSAAVYRRTAGHGCPFCKNRVLLTGFNDLQKTDEKLAAQFLPENNGGITPDQILGGFSSKKWVWTCNRGHNWSARVDSRAAGQGCPFCDNQALLTGYNDLKTKNKDLAAQFFSQNNGGITPDRVLGGSSNKKWVWTCELGHNWSAAVYNRTTGGSCPQCSKSGTSRVEQALFRVMSTHLADPVSGARIPLAWSSKQTTAAIDISGTYGGRTVAIEYDGAYWHHGAKRRTGDESKTRALIAAGYSVVRVRETGLTDLDIDDAGLLQLDYVYRPGTDAQIEAFLAPAVAAIMSWLEDQTALAAAA